MTIPVSDTNQNQRSFLYLFTTFHNHVLQVKMYAHEMKCQLTCENAISLLLIGDTYQLEDIKKVNLT